MILIEIQGKTFSFEFSIFFSTHVNNQRGIKFEIETF